MSRSAKKQVEVVVFVRGTESGGRYEQEAEEGTKRKDVSIGTSGELSSAS